MVPSRPLLYLTVPGIALMLGLIWFRRRKTVHCDNTGGKKQKDNLMNDTAPNNIANGKLKSSKSWEITKRGLEDCEGNVESKFGKSAPIDIVPNGKISPVYLSDKQIDTEILKIKIRDSEYKTLRSIEENNESISPLSLPDSVSRRNCLNAKFHVNVNGEQPVIVKATCNAKVSPKNSFLESQYTEECPQTKINVDKLDSAIKNDVDDLCETKKPLNLDIGTQPTSSPALSLCSVQSEDSGKGSSLPNTEEATIITYEFLLPTSLIGQLYGRKRAHINQIRSKTGANVIVKKHPSTDKIKICVIEGTQSEIDAALKLIRTKLPEKRYPNLTLQRVHYAEPQTIVPLPEIYRTCLQLHLVEGINNDVIVSSVISGGHLFLQQPLHPSHPSLSVLQNCLNQSYSNGEAPRIPDTADDAICVGKYQNSWYRVQIVDKALEKQSCLVKFVDYGGYGVIERENLRQIRADFLATPFQGIEVILADLKPTDIEWSEKSTEILYNLTKGIILQAQVVGYTSENIPEVYLYACLGPNNVIFINRELVARNLAVWTGN